MIEFIESNMAWFIVGLIVFDVYMLIEINLTGNWIRNVDINSINRDSRTGEEIYQLEQRLDNLENSIDDDF